MDDQKYIVDIKDLNLSAPPRHAVLPETLVERVERLKNILAEVELMPLEQALYNFRCDRHPESEVVIWEDIAKKYEQYILVNPQLSLEDKRNVYSKLLANSLEVNPISVSFQTMKTWL
ncbi:MAG: hypothetical protein ACD_72C00442G0011 [uncultured bacterium]|nr:MAG: hypothetical protein ACD_72C00442G0011 [uncultured bacterium]